MNMFKWVALLLLLCVMPAHAFTTVDEQIDHYQKVLSFGSYAEKIETLKRLQWSGISDPRLYDDIRASLRFPAMRSDNNLNKETRSLVAHQIRALGYSGNERYRSDLENIKKNSKNNKFRSHAKKALIQLDKFKHWNSLIAQSDVQADGKSVEVKTYLKMLNTDDVLVQRLAARATFHERQLDPDLLELTADKLKGLYMQTGLDGQAQDTVAWFCKALGQSGELEYMALLSDVAKSTPYKKVKKHAQNYALLYVPPSTDSSVDLSDSINLTGSYIARVSRERSSDYFCFNNKKKFRIQLMQTNNIVKGRFLSGIKGEIEGTVDKNKVKFTYYTARCANDITGEWTIDSDGSSLEGYGWSELKWSLQKN